MYSSNKILSGLEMCGRRGAARKKSREIVSNRQEKKDNKKKNAF